MEPLCCLCLFSLLFCRCIQFVGCDICEDETFNYEIGKKLTILDIDADSISALSKTCFKTLNFPGIENATLSVDTASYSADKYWTYNSNVGTLIKLYYDKAFINFGECASRTLKKTEVREGLVQNFNSNILCIIFEPETEFKPLGGHAVGGRIQLTVRVNIARCNIGKERTQSGSELACYDLCSADGVVKTCARQSANSTSTVRPRVSSRDYRKSSIASLIGMKPAKTTFRATFESRSTTKSHSSGFTTHALLTPTAVHTSKSSSFKTSTMVPSIYNRSSVVSTTRISIQTVSMSTSKSFSNSQAATTTAQVTQGLTPEVPHTPNDDSDNEAMFGLRSVNIFAGCGLLVAIIFSVTCCVVCRKRRCFCQKGLDTAASVISSDTFTTNKDLMWRHNWLARYHSNPAFIRADSEIDYDQLNHELFVDIARRQCRNSQKSDATDPYDTPWPLVRLGSDFVRDTKRLDTTSSDDNFTCSDHIESVSYQSIHSTGDIKETICEDIAYQKQNRKQNIHECTYAVKSDKTRECCKNPEYQNSLKNTKPSNPTRNLLSNVRARNGCSKFDTNPEAQPEKSRSTSCSDSNVSSVNEDLHRSRTGSVHSNEITASNTQRERNSSGACSSLCSFRSKEVVPESDEGKPKQLQSDEVFVQTGYNSGSPEKRGWILKKALYAIVSRRDRTSQPCGTSGTMQFPK